MQWGEAAMEWGAKPPWDWRACSIFGGAEAVMRWGEAVMQGGGITIKQNTNNWQTYE